MRNFALVDSIAMDCRHAARSLRRSPTFTVAAVLTLVIGIGASTTIFSIVNGILLRPLPYAAADRLVGTWHDMPAINLPRAPQSVQTYFTYRKLARTIDAIGIYRESAANVSVPGQASDPQRLAIASCTASLLKMLGTRPVVGRLFTEDEDLAGAAPVVLISEGLWRSQFGADPMVIGKRLDVNGVTRSIVGVMPAAFRLPSSEAAVWLPLNLDPANPPPTAFTYTGIARLKRGVTIDEAQRDFTTVLPRVTDLFEKFVPGITMREIMAQTNPRPVLTPLRDDVTRGFARLLWVVGGAVMLVFIVACVNVGNLSVVRFEARRRELGVRHALGAATARVSRYFMVELALVASTACFVAILLALAAVHTLVSKGPGDIPRLAELRVDGTSVAFAAMMAVLATVISGAIPVARIRRGDLRLTQTSRGGTASRAEHQTRRVLVAAQIALALVVIAGSGLLFRSFRRLNAVRPGFDPDRVATYWISLPAGRYRSDTSVIGFYSNLLDRARAIPAAGDVGLTSRLPLISRGFNDNPIYPEGITTSDGKLPPLQLVTTVGGDYFRALRIPLVAGKLFDGMRAQHEGDAIVSRRTAALFWHDSTGRSVVGKRFRVLPTSQWYTVVGVVADVHDSTLATAPSPTVYFPETKYTDHAQSEMTRTMALVIRTQTDPTATSALVRRAVHDLDPALPVFDIQSMSTAMHASTARLRFIVYTLATAAFVTLMLGAIGLYGVMAYVVSLRRRELGIRLALGATPGSIARAMTREAMGVTGTGLMAGLALFAIASRFVHALLFGVSPWDPGTLAAASVLLFAAALLATWMPARRAAGVDPAETLRAD